VGFFLFLIIVGLIIYFIVNLIPNKEDKENQQYIREQYYGEGSKEPMSKDREDSQLPARLDIDSLRRDLEKYQQERSLFERFNSMLFEGFWTDVDRNVIERKVKLIQSKTSLIRSIIDMRKTEGDYYRVLPYELQKRKKEAQLELRRQELELKRIEKEEKELEAQIKGIEEKSKKTEDDKWKEEIEKYERQQKYMGKITAKEALGEVEMLMEAIEELERAKEEKIEKVRQGRKDKELSEKELKKIKTIKEIYDQKIEEVKLSRYQEK